MDGLSLDGCPDAETMDLAMDVESSAGRGAEGSTTQMGVSKRPHLRLFLDTPYA
jgi:hypothetical protein